MLTVLAFYFGNRFGQVFDFNTMEITDGALVTVNSIVAAPAAISTASVPMLYAIGLAITVLIVWLYTFMYAGNYRYGEEAGSAKWGTLKEGVAFKDQTDPSNNLLFTKNYGLALKKPKFDLEHDRNLNVMVIGGSGSGKTRNYVKPNLMQLNASYFLTDPKGTSLPECGYLFRDNGYRIRAFNTIEFNKSMHYNPLKYVKTDADILSFVNCLISNTNGDKQSGGDPFWENSERLLYTALIALLRDWFPPEDYSLDGLLTLLSMAEAKENDENFKSPLDMIFDEIETGKVYERNPFYQGPSTSSSYADAESDRMAISENTTDEFTWQSSLMERNNDGLSPAREGGLTSDQDFALANYKMFKVAAGKTLKSIIISCNVRMAPMRIEQVRELLKYDEMNLDEMGDPGQRTAIFAIMSDTDKTFSFLHAIMMWQSIDILCRRALEKYNGKLPTMVNFIFDEFANIGTIPDIEQTIAVTRSRNIGISIILQSVAQLESRYDKKAKTIIDCCDTTLFLGGKSNSTNKEISEMIGKQTIIVNGISQVKIDSLDAITVSEKVGDSPGAAGSLFVTSLAMLLVSFVVKGAVSVMCYMRAFQLYVFTAFSPIPFALLGFDETKNYGISFCKNYLGICLSGAVIILALSAFPSLLSGFSGGEITGIKGEMWGSLCAVLAMTLIIIKSGTIARDILGG